jgi:hypothetical protein
MSRIRDGKIAEEWVCRDELGMLLQLWRPPINLGMTALVIFDRTDQPWPPVHVCFALKACLRLAATGRKRLRVDKSTP